MSVAVEDTDGSPDFDDCNVRKVFLGAVLFVVREAEKVAGHESSEKFSAHILSCRSDPARTNHLVKSSSFEDGDTVNAVSVLEPSLTAIFNASLAAGELPRAFKQADIVPVYKSGDRETASNYRPISLLPIVSKLLEKIVSTQLKAFLASNSLLPEIQFAYRANHSTEDALAFIVNRFLLERDCGKATGIYSLCRPNQGV